MIFTEDIIQKNNNQSGLKIPLIILGFKKLPVLEPKFFEILLKNINPLKEQLSIITEPDFNNGKKLLAAIEFDNHKIHLIGFNKSMPKEILKYSSQDLLKNIKEHKAHIMCYYMGSSTSPKEQYDVLYKTAYALHDSIFIAINKESWIFQPSSFIKKMSLKIHLENTSS